MYKELLEYVVKNLINNKDAVVVEENATESKVVLRLKVAKEDMGRVIGKEGRIIRSIREILNAYTAKNKQRVAVEIEEKKKKKKDIFMESILIGKIVNTHGIKGEVKVYPYTDDIDNLSKIKEVSLFFA